MYMNLCISNNPNSQTLIKYGVSFLIPFLTAKAALLTAELCPERTSHSGSSAAYPLACPGRDAVGCDARLPVSKPDPEPRHPVTYGVGPEPARSNP